MYAKVFPPPLVYRLSFLKISNNMFNEPRYCEKYWFRIFLLLGRTFSSLRLYLFAGKSISITDPFHFDLDHDPFCEIMEPVLQCLGFIICIKQIYINLRKIYDMPIILVDFSNRIQFPDPGSGSLKWIRIQGCEIKRVTLIPILQ